MNARLWVALVHLTLSTLVAACAAASGQNPFAVTAITVLMFSPLVIGLHSRDGRP